MFHRHHREGLVVSCPLMTGIAIGMGVVVLTMMMLLLLRRFGELKMGAREAWGSGLGCCGIALSLMYGMDSMSGDGQ